MKKAIFIIPLFLLFAFTVGDNRSIYEIPHTAGSLCSADIDLDGDEDLILSINIDVTTMWSGIYILENDGKGNFSYLDSISCSGGTAIYSEFVFDNQYPDIITKDSYNLYVVSNNGEEYKLQIFPLGDRISDFDIGDFDNDGDIDVAFISNNNYYWGIIYNIDKNSFSEPEYFQLDFPLVGIATGDINNDGSSEIAICGQNSSIYFICESGVDSISLNNSSEEIELVDLDGDGDLDVISFSDYWSWSHAYIFENRENGSVFDSVTSFIVPEGCTSMSIADFDNNSYNDIAFLPHSNYNRYILFKNHGNFNFGESIDIDTEIFPYESGRHFCCNDFDGNGFPDIASTHRIGHVASSGILDIKFNNGNGDFVEDPLESVDEISNALSLNFTNYPNPFTTSTTFEFTIENKSQIEISVYDLRGNLVKSLTNKTMKGGSHKIKWGGLNNASQACKPGPYFAYLKVNGTFMQSIKLIIY